MESVGMATSEVTQETIVKDIKSIKPEQAILEIITNAIDAWAKNIHINFTQDEIGGIDTITFKDDGEWIEYDNIKSIFWNYSNSTKPLRQKKTPSQYCWRKGIWRYTFSKIWSNAIWETTFTRWENNYSYKITMDHSILRDYIYDEDTYPSETESDTGTILTINNIDSNTISDDFIKQTAIPQILKQEGWRMILLWVRIFVNENEINVKEGIEKEKSKTIRKWGKDFSIRIVKWKQPISWEDSQSYFINSQGIEKYKEHTWFNRWSDGFCHSVFVKSGFFDDFLFWNWEIIQENEWKIFKELKREINQLLRDFRRSFLKAQAEAFTEKLVQDWIIMNWGTSPIQEYSSQFMKETIEELYICEPKIVNSLSIEQKKIFFRMLGTIAEKWWEDKLLEIIEHVLNLTEEEKERFAEILKDVSLKNIIKTITIIEDRLKVLSVLEQYLEKPEIWANEKDDLQWLISQHYWIFWEGYALYANEEEDIKKIVVKIRNEVFEDGVQRKDLSFEWEDKELDIFMCKTLRSTTTEWIINVDNVVVELKHPTKILGDKEKRQVEGYMQAFSKDPKLNWEFFSWKYILVGTSINENSLIPGAIESASNWWEKKFWLIQNNKNMRIYVRKWCDIIAECRSKMQYLYEALNLRYDRIKAQSQVSTLEEADAILDNSAVAVLPQVE